MNQQSNILLINPAIANVTGVNEAMILQQLYYWHKKYPFQEWIYNSYEEWKKQFSFWSIRTIRRIFASLEKQGYIKSKRSRFCKFYKLCDETRKKFFLNQDSPKSPPGVAKMDTPINNKEAKNTQKISSYIKKEEKIKNEVSQYKSQMDPLGKNQDKHIEEEMVRIWNKVFEYSLNPIKAYSGRTIGKKLINIYYNKFNKNLQEWKIYAAKVNSSRFLMGEKKTDNNFKAVFPWLIKEETVDAIQSDSYGVGDRKLDVENLDHNIKTQGEQIKQEIKDKIAVYLKNKISAEEKKEFREYLFKRKYEEDGDKYKVKKHMEEIGRYYMYAGYITPSHVYYPGNERYKDRIFNSYIMSKYYGLDEFSLEDKCTVYQNNEDKGSIFHMLKRVKNKISKYDIFYAITTSTLPLINETFVMSKF